MPVLAADAPPDRAKELGRTCRDLGLEPLHDVLGRLSRGRRGLDVLKHRIRQAAAAGVAQVLTFGHTKGGNRKLWVETLQGARPDRPRPRRDDRRQAARRRDRHRRRPAPRSSARSDDEGVKVNYDAGNVMDYLDVDPIPDLRDLRRRGPRASASRTTATSPRTRIAAPASARSTTTGCSHPVAFTGRDMPLCCENISAPLLPRPTDPEGIDALARRAREFLEVVIRGLQA